MSTDEVQATLHALSSSQILILRDINEWSAPEAADYLGITVEAAKSRLHRARNLMKARLMAGRYSAGDAC